MGDQPRVVLEGLKLGVQAVLSRELGFHNHGPELGNDLLEHLLRLVWQAVLMLGVTEHRVVLEQA